MDEIRALAEEKEQARDVAEESGLSDLGFSVYWLLSQDASLKGVTIDYRWVAGEVEVAVDQYPHWRQNPDEKRMLRTSLYKPLVKLPPEPRSQVIDQIMHVLEAAQ